MNKYIAIFLFLLCTSCNVSAEAIFPIAVPVPKLSINNEKLSINAFGKMEEYHSDWMYYLGNCQKKCEE